MNLLKMWCGYNLPDRYIYFSDSEKNLNLLIKGKLYLYRFFIHPVKRRIARCLLKFYQHFFGLTVIGLTGSAGKTTTKEMLYSILKQKGETVASYANIDPVYNIPSTILKLKPSTKFLILEMGVEYVGEMDYYLWLAKPKVAAITNIYPTHTLFLKDIKGVETEKMKLAKAVSKNGWVVLNGESLILKKYKDSLRAKTIFFGDESVIYAQNVSLNILTGTKYTLHLKESKYTIHIPILGRQFVSNSLCAASVADLLGCSGEEIKSGLKNFSLPEHRMRVKKLLGGTIVIDDTYNNNLEAAKSSLKTLEEVSSGKDAFIVLGDMLELGSLEEKFHRELGIEVAKLNPKFFIGVGEAISATVNEASKAIGKDKVIWVKDIKQVTTLLKDKLGYNSVVLVKGSRALGLDKIVSGLSKGDKDSYNEKTT